MRPLLLLLVIPALACRPDKTPAQDRCSDPPPDFVAYVNRTLTDSTGLFKNDYPPVTPLACEVLGWLQVELTDDSARYFFERFARRYWSEEPHAMRTHSYIRRHLSFPLAMAAAAHWFADTRIEGLKELQEYRRMRPLVCATKEYYERLEQQDRAAVRYLIRVLENTPHSIPGSENATIHDFYMNTVMHTLDLFTGQDHHTATDATLPNHRSEASMQQALKDWHAWLKE